MTAPGNAPPPGQANAPSSGGNVHTIPKKLAAAAAKLAAPLHIKGGAYDPATIMKLMNDRYFVASWGGTPQIISILPGDKVEAIKREGFYLLLENVFVSVPTPVRAEPTKTTRVPAAKYWLADKGRRERDLVIFDPHEPIGFNHPKSFNLWRGFAIQPDPNTNRLGLILNHINTIICDGDAKSFEYYLDWLAHTVQRPWEQCIVMVVLRGDHEGSGKSTVSEIMLKIFGHGEPGHGRIIKSMNELIGQFTPMLETAIFVAEEEILWAGDPKAADALKSTITASHIKIERKFFASYYVPNRLRHQLTTNHSWAIPAGFNARRFLVLDANGARIGDKPYFDALFNDINNGGAEQFLHFLLSRDISGFSPNSAPLRTASLMDQQFKSIGSVEAWLYDVVVWEKIGRDRGRRTSPGTLSRGRSPLKI